MKIANIDREILHYFWTTWGISMKFSGKMYLMIILKVTKNQGFNLGLEDTIFKKPQRQGGVKLPPPPPPPYPHPPAVVVLKCIWSKFKSISPNFWQKICFSQFSKLSTQSPHSTFGLQCQHLPLCYWSVALFFIFA